MFSLNEILFTLRLIRQKIGFSLLCALVIALGFTIVIPLYAVVKSIVFPDLPGTNDDRLVIVSQLDVRIQNDLTTNSFDPYQYQVILERNQSFELLSALRDELAVFSDGETPAFYNGQVLTANSLQMMGVNPILGRLISESDETVGAERVVLISFDLWQNYYQGDVDIVGKQSTLNGVPYTVIGVMPAGFAHPQFSDYWAPLRLDGAYEPGSGPGLGLFGVLAPRVSRAEASEDLKGIVEDLSAEFPDQYPSRSARIIPYSQGWINTVTLYEIAGLLALCIYVLVCLNIGNLLLIQANKRVGELAIRSAMGADRFSLIRHVLFESFVICLFGAVAGMIVAGWVLSILQSYFFTVFMGGEGTPYWFDFTVNSNIVGIALLMLVVLWLLGGFFAAWRVTNSDINKVLGGTATNKGATLSTRLTSSLVFGQICLSFFLLCLSGSFLYGFVQAYRVAPVSEADRFLLASFRIESNNEFTRYDDYEFAEELKLRLVELPEIEGVSYTQRPPGERGNRISIALPNEQVSVSEQQPIFSEVGIDEGYFELLGTQLLAGRALQATDVAESEPIAVIENELVERLGFSESPLGQFLTIARDDSGIAETVRIVGVVSSFASGNVGSNVYRPYSQVDTSSIYMIIKLNQGQEFTSELEERIKVVGAAVDRTIPFYSFDLLSNRTGEFNSFNSLFVSLFGSPVIGALLLSAVGVYGLISRSIYDRFKEIGVRRAMGSTNGAIVRRFVGRGATFLLVGAAIGGGGAVLLLDMLEFISGWSLASSLVTVLLSVTATMTLIVALATYLPSRKAVSIEPGDALHYE